MTLAEYPMSIYRVSLRQAIPGAVATFVVMLELFIIAAWALR